LVGCASANANRAEKSKLTGGHDALARAARITLRIGHPGGA